MNLSLVETEIVRLLRDTNRPLVNILSLDHIMNYGSGKPKEYSVMLKSCAFFYKFGIDNREMFQYLDSFTGTILPWNGLEQDNWIYPGLCDDENRIIRERNKKLWFKLLDRWYEIFFKNPHFYLKWSELDGWGWYLRHHVDDIRTILNSDVMRNSTFMESITEFQMEILKAFGFRSFFRYHNQGSPDSSLWIVYGFWWFANSRFYSPIRFDHLYDVNEINDCDDVIRLPYRSMVQWYRRVWEEKINEDVSRIYDIFEFNIGPLTQVDRIREEMAGNIDHFEGHLITNDEGTNIGMEETCREMYFSMRVRYHRNQLDQVQYLPDSAFVIKYDNM